MLLFRSLFGGKAPAKKASASVRPKPTNSSADYRAVSVTPSIDCYAVAKEGAGKRYLLREAPQLPLASCATPATCSCRFRRHADRREGDRRLFGEIESTRWFGGSERRERRTRRSAKKIA
jgi:hypothetical protein